jgi:hypothetical protein
MEVINMTYNETLKFIENELENIKIKIFDNPELILSYRIDKRTYLASIGTYIAGELSKKISTPWVSKEELSSFYKETCYSNTGRNKRLKLRKHDITIYSSIIHKKSCIIDNVVYMHLLLNNNGLDNSYINPNLLIKFDLSSFLICTKLTHNLDITVNEYKDNNIDIEDKIIYNL